MTQAELVQDIRVHGGQIGDHQLTAGDRLDHPDVDDAGIGFAVRALYVVVEILEYGHVDVIEDHIAVDLKPGSRICLLPVGHGHEGGRTVRGPAQAVQVQDQASGDLAARGQVVGDRAAVRPGWPQHDDDDLLPVEPQVAGPGQEALVSAQVDIVILGLAQDLQLGPPGADLRQHVLVPVHPVRATGFDRRLPEPVHGERQHDPRLQAQGECLLEEDQITS